MKVGVSIDFYDTLVEIDHDVPTLAAALSDLGFPCSPAVETIWNSPGFDGQATRDAAGGNYEDWRRGSICQLARLCGVPEPEVGPVANHLLDLDRQWTVRAREGATALLETIDRAGLARCILTNWDYPIAPYLRMAGLDPTIPAITSAELGFRKPVVEAFERVRALMGVEPPGHIHIGDSWTADVVGAIRSGARVIWVTEQAPSEPLPERIVPSRLKDVPQRLLSMLEEPERV